MENFKLNIETRTATGSSNSRRDRMSGKVPAIVYGNKVASPVSILVNHNEFDKLFKKAGESSIIELESPDGKWNVVVAETQSHPYKGNYTHIDFRAVSMDEEITVTIPVDYVGVAPAIKEFGGVLFSNMDEVEIECLPGDLIHNIEVDISTLAEIGDSLHVSDIKLPAKIKMVTDPESVLVSIAASVSEEDMVANTESDLPESEKGGDEEGSEGGGTEGGEVEASKEEKSE